LQGIRRVNAYTAASLFRRGHALEKAARRLHHGFFSVIAAAGSRKGQI